MNFERVCDKKGDNMKNIFFIGMVLMMRDAYTSDTSHVEYEPDDCLSRIDRINDLLRDIMHEQQGLSYQLKLLDLKYAALITTIRKTFHEQRTTAEGALDVLFKGQHQALERIRSLEQHAVEHSREPQVNNAAPSPETFV